MTKAGKYRIKFVYYNIASRKRLQWHVNKKTLQLEWGTLEIKSNRKHVCTFLHEKMKPSIPCREWKKGLVIVTDIDNQDILFVAIPSEKRLSCTVPSSQVKYRTPVDKYIMKQTKPSIYAAVAAIGSVVVGSSIIAVRTKRNQYQRLVQKIDEDYEKLLKIFDDAIKKASSPEKISFITSKTLQDLTDCHKQYGSAFKRYRYFAKSEKRKDIVSDILRVTSQSSLAQQLLMSKRISDMTQSFDKHSTIYQEFVKKFNDSMSQTGDIQQELRQFGPQIQQNVKELSTVQQELRQFGHKIQQNVTELSDVQQELRQFGPQVRQNLQRVKNELSAVHQELHNLKENEQNVNNAMAHVKRRLEFYQNMQIEYSIWKITLLGAFIYTKNYDKKILVPLDEILIAINGAITADEATSSKSQLGPILAATVQAGKHTLLVLSQDYQRIKTEFHDKISTALASLRKGFIAEDMSSIKNSIDKLRQLKPECKKLLVEDEVKNVMRAVNTPGLTFRVLKAQYLRHVRLFNNNPSDDYDNAFETWCEDGLSKLEDLEKDCKELLQEKKLKTAEDLKGWLKRTHPDKGVIGDAEFKANSSCIRHAKDEMWLPSSRESNINEGPADDID